MKTIVKTLFPMALLLMAAVRSYGQMASFALDGAGSGPGGDLVISRAPQPLQPFTVAGTGGVLVGTQDGQFESWILPVKLMSHLTIEANIEGYSVPILVNPQAANIEVRPDHTTITYAHLGFTIRQIMFSPDAGESAGGAGEAKTGPVVLFQIDSVHAMDLVFRFTPEMRWMWPKRNDGIPSPEWVPVKAQGDSGVAEPGQAGGEGFYVLHMDYPDLAGAITIPTATPGIAAPYQERPQVHPLELHLHYDPKRDGTGAHAKYFPLLMAAGSTAEAASNEALGRALAQLHAGIPAAYSAHAARYGKMLAEATSIETPDKALNAAFGWGVASIEQLRAEVPRFGAGAQETALVAGYFASGDSARPGFGWFFGRDSLYTLYAVNSFGDFRLSRSELAFLIARQRADGKIMHEFAQTAGDSSVEWKKFEYMYAAADATPLFLMAMRDYLRSSGDVEFVRAHREAIEKAWGFETAGSSDTDHDGIYDNSQGTGWVESWPQGQPHQEVYLALLDEQASRAYAAMETALGEGTKAAGARGRAADIRGKIEDEYYDKAKHCYAFSHNVDGSQDKASTVYAAVAWWDLNSADEPIGNSKECLRQWAGPTIATDWGLRDVATTESFYDGMSYHQGSVWPLFTGWGAMAEYRANQPLPAQQMLMQNVDLTWAQDPGAVTELLSGDFFVPFGRSTSHQLWSSAMVITPALRGLFGVSVDAGTNTVTVNPHLPGGWDTAAVHNLHVGKGAVDLKFTREKDKLRVEAVEKGGAAGLVLRSDGKGVREAKGSGAVAIELPLPAVEIVIPEFALPTPGARPSQPKILSTTYAERSLTVAIAGMPGTEMSLGLRMNLPVQAKVALVKAGEHAGAAVSLESAKGQGDGKGVSVHFPAGQGWQTVEFVVSW